MRTICGIPREAVAFAGGIHSVSPRTWEEIAAALAMLGFGYHDPVALEEAVGEWGIERVDLAMRLRAAGHRVVAGAPVEALDRGRVVRRGGGFKS